MNPNSTCGSAIPPNIIPCSDFKNLDSEVLRRISLISKRNWRIIKNEWEGQKIINFIPIFYYSKTRAIINDGKIFGYSVPKGFLQQPLIVMNR